MVKLARLPANWDKQSQLFPRYWDTVMSAIESIFNQLLSLPDIQDAINQANTAATQAQQSADGAAVAVESTNSRQSLSDSYVTGLTLSADSTGAVIISGHTRVYGDTILNPAVAVTGSSVSTGATPGQVVRIYYNDTSRSGGAVTYAFTIDPANPPAQTGTTHSVGAVTIPTTGTATGKGCPPPGYVYV